MRSIALMICFSMFCGLLFSQTEGANKRKRFSHLTKVPKRETAFDRYRKGDATAMSKEALRGHATAEKYGCLTCHSGPEFNGGGYQPFPLVAGSEYDERYRLTENLGRFEETGRYTDRHLWQVKTLRNVAATAPYFHNESVSSLAEAVRVMARTQLGRVLTDNEVREIVEFLKAL